MKILKKALTALAAASIITAATLTPLSVANAASGATNVTFKFPEIIILHHIKKLDITFKGDEDTAYPENDASDGGALGDLTVEAAVTTTGGGNDPQELTLTVNNAWAVRGIVSGGKIKVSGALTTPNATNGTASKVVTSNLEVTQGGDTGTSITVPAPGMKKANAVKGGVKFKVDYSGVTDSAIHTGMVYTITAAKP